MRRPGEHLKTAFFFYRWIPRLPPRVALFYVRARILARKLEDQHALVSFTHPMDIARILALSNGCSHVVEIGTSEGWSAIAFALADDARRVSTYDPTIYATRDRYIALGGAASARVTFITALGEQPISDDVADFVFIDGAHDKETTRAAFEAWRGRLAVGGRIVFHDYGWSGVRDAIAELDLGGRVDQGMYIWP
ncbi:MAG TPA: class I SAM-dependent methyltransferase [Solirubrobacteraceae bacterium]|jgi:predicted O-methyltransferase YrrM|nr:class I SAM-dependent methyltransferase [Solirubrobacteraceae bacterium]